MTVALGCSSKGGDEQRQQLTALKSLDAGVEFDEQGHVRFINFSRGAVTNDDLAGLVSYPELRELWLYDTRIADAGLKHLSQLKTLEILVLSKTDITDDGLLGLARLTGLKELYIGETDISVAAIQRLQQLMPDTKIVL
jgi:hypothetical protein